MDGVIQSSSQVGSSVSTMARSFDVGNESDLLKLLNFIRRGPFESVNKNALRDAVLDFSVNKDPAGLTELATLLNNNNVSLTQDGAPLVGEIDTKTTPSVAATDNEPVNKPTVPVQNGFGGARPQPAFNAVDSLSVSEPQPEAETEMEVATKPEAINQAETKIDSEIEPNINVVPIKVDNTVPSAPAPSAAVIPEPVPTPEPEPVPTPTPTPTPEPVASVPPGESVSPLDRVKEIKRMVNEKVGNPVNLIDANNAIGREYMNSLLNAMKRVNGGSDDEINLAMERLEKAYASVKQSIESGETVIGVPDKSSTTAAPIATTPDSQNKWASEPNPDPAPAQSPIPEPKPESESVSPAPAPAPSPTASEPESKPEPVVMPSVPTPPIPTPPNSEPALAPESVENTVPTPEPEPESVPVPIPSSQSDPVISDTEEVVQPENPGAPMSLAAKLQAESTERANLTATRAAELQVKEKEVNADPLHANEISSGLQQLLSEWKLFKSSGIFGTGPSGYEHPLYQTLSAIPMAAIIAGRYEGATPEIKQSITDYMNGWRYEQNVVHEMNETFEHYLRRVISAILSKQRQNPSA